MPHLLFKLNNVPYDEADEVRTLLTEHQIDFYETSAGRWGVSMAGIWLKEEERLAEARVLIDTYQQQRAERVKAEYAEQRAAGEHDTFLKRLLREPIKMVIYLTLAGIILYFSVRPFLHFK